jgi:hypothetical protein
MILKFNLEYEETKNELVLTSLYEPLWNLLVGGNKFKIDLFIEFYSIFLKQRV